jgi:hypothetical protein
MAARMTPARLWREVPIVESMKPLVKTRRFEDESK